jgi:predicted PurR-regulated permease PerM
MIKEFIFLLLAIVIFPIVAVLGVLYTLIKHVVKWDYRIEKQLLPIIRSFSLCLDGFANASAGELLNDIFKIPKDFKARFGKWYQTISAVTGILKVYFGKDIWLRKSLEILGKNHCEDAITVEEHFYYGQNNRRKN